MKVVIDADTSRLVGFLVALFQEVRQGHITVEHLKWFTGLTKDARDAFLEGGESALN